MNDWDLVLPESNQLQMDIDDDESYEFMVNMIALLQSNGFAVELTKTTISKSGNRHCYIKTPWELSLVDRIALQASMGSDRKREILSLVSIYKNEGVVTCLYEVKR